MSQPSIKVAFSAEVTKRLDDCADRLLSNATVIVVATMLYRLSGERILVDQTAAVADTRCAIHELVEIAVASMLSASNADSGVRN